MGKAKVAAGNKKKAASGKQEVTVEEGGSLTEDARHRFAFLIGAAERELTLLGTPDGLVNGKVDVVSLNGKIDLFVPFSMKLDPKRAGKEIGPVEGPFTCTVVEKIAPERSGCGTFSMKVTTDRWPKQTFEARISCQPKRLAEAEGPEVSAL